MQQQNEQRADLIGAYVRELFVPRDEVLDGFEQELERAGIPLIQVPPELGKLLGLLVRLMRSRRVLEIGTLGGYSAAWMARALPEGGRLITLEKSAKHAEFARSFLARAGVVDKVEVVVGSALDTLPALLEREEPQFDMVFIDADKESYPGYLDWSIRLLRPGGLIVADNVLRGGKVMEPGDDAVLNGVAEFNQHAAASPLLDSLILPNRNGQDGILLAVVREQQ
ncbi:MAG: O-methyltransferase [Chloroflexota bacterium]|nr:O-methyltransferase [Chloroflexota bacterium]